jgi:DNA topoisomerase-6 subunit B
MVATSVIRSDEGNVFVVEGGLVYDKEGSFDQKIEIIRIANNVPLMFQPGACALQRLTAEFNWKNTGLSQTKGELPYAPAKLLLHLAAVKVKFTSESKDAIADNSSIAESVTEVLKNLNQQFLKFRNKEKLLLKNKQKQKIINHIIPALYAKLSSVLSVPTPPSDYLYSKIVSAPIVRLKLINNCLYCKIINTTFEKYRFEITDNMLNVHQVILDGANAVVYYRIDNYFNNVRLIVNEALDKSFFIKAEPNILI